jgi:hypothetical protein
MKQEMYLRSLKPKVWELENEEHPETQDSLAWAEKKLGKKLVIPHLDPAPLTESPAYNAIFDYNDDEDVSSTLKSAHQAEMIYGLHNTNSYGNYGNGGEKKEGEEGA